MNINHAKKEVELPIAERGDIVATDRSTYLIVGVMQKTTTGYSSYKTYTAINLDQNCTIFHKYNTPQEVYEHFKNETSFSEVRLVKANNATLNINE